MFRNVFYMDLKRGMYNWRFVAVVIAAAAFLAASSGDFIVQLWRIGRDPVFMEGSGAVDLLHSCMGFDVFKVVTVLLLSGLYAGSFCRDENSRYLRMILSRTDTLVYARTRFLSNLVIMLTASLAACWLCIGMLMLFGFSFISVDAEGGLLGAAYYIGIIEQYPAVYVCMIGLQFGMVAAACSSAGILLSGYQANMYVTIGVSGFLFLILMSLPIINGTPFDVLNIVGMGAVLSAKEQTPYALSFAWGMLYPAVMIAVCCLLFERRMKWRAEHGII